MKWTEVIIQRNLLPVGDHADAPDAPPEKAHDKLPEVFFGGKQGVS